MDHRGIGKKVVAVDDNPLHTNTFKHIALQLQGIDLSCFKSGQLTGKAIPQADLYLLCGDLEGACSRLLLHSLFEQYSECIVIFYTQSLDGFSASHFRDNRHRLFLLCHDMMVENLEDILVRVMMGTSLPSVDQLICRALSDQEFGGHGLNELTMREMEVFCLFGQGCGAHEISLRLNLSKNTVNFHIKGMKRKLGGKNTVDLRMNAIRFSRGSACQVLSKGSEHLCPHIEDSIGKCPCRV